MADEAELIERAAFADVYAAAPADVRARLGLRTLEVDGVLAGIAPGLPASAIVLNRAIGLGTSRPASPQAVSELVEAYRAAGASRYFVHAHPDAAPGNLRDLLSAAGLVRARAWQKFRRDRSPPPAGPGGPTVRAVGREHGDDFAQLVCAAFDLGDAAVEWLCRIPGREGWRILMAFDQGRPAATGALFMRDGIGWFDFAATSPDFRRRGAQSALLRQRIALALEAGCRVLYTATGEAVPGDPQHSYSNILKAGFTETLLRDNYAPPR